MKQSTTNNTTRGRKPATGNSTSKDQRKTGNRQTSSVNGRQNGANNSRQPNSGESSSLRGQANMQEPNRKKDTAQQGTDHQSHFKGESHLEKFFLDQLKDIYYAENKILQSLPKMKDAATTGELQEAFEDHLHQTQRHVKRLEKVFQTIDQKAEGKKCEAIEGISREVESIISQTEEGTMTRDAALIIAAQKVEHYEIATYGGLLQLAITMQLHDAADLLDKTLIEEEDTDAKLTEIAENEINLGAEHEGNHHGHSQGSEEDGEEDVDEESPSIH
jgi:ferritin-like metal-binding protein YciE